MVINNKIINIFNPNIILSNCLKSDEYDEYQHLVRAIRRARTSRTDEVLCEYDTFKTQTEFYKYSNNLILLCEINNSFVYQLMIDGRVGPECTDINDPKIKDMFVFPDLMIMDSNAKLLSIHTYPDFMSFMKSVQTARNHLNDGRDAYHKYMEKLYEYRKIKNNYPNENPGKYFAECLELADEYGKELRDLLTETYFDDERKMSECFNEVSDRKKHAIIFGLYLACLRSYALDDELKGKSLTYDEVVYLGFMKEFNLLLQSNNNIVEVYADIFHLRKCEIEAIRKLLKEQNLDGTEWLNDKSNLYV